MTTATVTTVIDQTSDAGFRAWVAEFIAQLLAVGIVQTADTGQINTASVNRAAANNDAGYAVFRLDDSLQATAPIFFKVYFGSGFNNTVPRIRVQTGTASNGSGTVSGTGSANTDTASMNNALLSTITTYTSYFCFVEGCLWWSFKVGAGSTNAAFSHYRLARTTDNDGDPTAEGFIQTAVNGTGVSNAIARTIVFSSSTVYAGGSITNWALVHYDVSSSLVGGTPQVYKTYYITPRVRPDLFGVAVIDAECARGVELQATVVGVTERNYINAANAGSTTRSLACIWE